MYLVVDLRPGSYTVTFMLPGFRVVKREGIELSGSFAATINADMSVGAVEETVTVTGESRTVDVLSTKRSNVISTEVVEALPAARSQCAMVALLLRCREVRGAVRAPDGWFASGPRGQDSCGDASASSAPTPSGDKRSARVSCRLRVSTPT